MPAEPFPPDGPGGEEPEGPALRPERGAGPQDHTREPGSGPDGRGPAGPPAPPDGGGDADEMPPEGAGQGLFICVPAGSADLSGFAAGEAGAVEVGPVLAGVAAAVADSDGTGLARTSEECLYAVMSAGRRMSSWGTWLELAAMRELAVRPPAVPDRPARTNRPATPGHPPAQDRAATQHS